MGNKRGGALFDFRQTAHSVGFHQNNFSFDDGERDGNKDPYKQTSCRKGFKYSNTNIKPTVQMHRRRGIGVLDLILIPMVVLGCLNSTAARRNGWLKMSNP